MEAQFKAFVGALDNLIFTITGSIFLTLLLVAIGIGVIKKMFVFGNLQTISTANKIIMTAFISGIVIMIILPIKDFVMSDLKVEMNQPITIVGGEENVYDYSDLKNSTDKINKFADNIYNAIYGAVFMLAVISVGISVLRIKFSMGNVEVISESRKLIKTTITAAIIMMAATGIFDYFNDRFSRDLPNPILDALNGQEGEGGEGSSIDRVMLADASFTQKISRAPDPGFIVTLGIQVRNVNQLGRPAGNSNEEFIILAKPNEAYTFKSPRKNFNGVQYLQGSSPLKYLDESMVIWVFVNSGWKATVTSPDGFLTIQVPRSDKKNKLKDLKVYDPNQINKDTKKSDLTEGEDYIELDLDENERFPQPDETHAAVMFSTVASAVSDAPNAYEHLNLTAIKFRYIGGLKWESDLADNQYSFIVTFSEDDDAQKEFKRVSILEDADSESKNIPVAEKYHTYVLLSDRSEQIENTSYNYKDGLKLEEWLTEADVSDTGFIQKLRTLSDKELSVPLTGKPAGEGGSNG